LFRVSKPDSGYSASKFLNGILEAPEQQHERANVVGPGSAGDDNSGTTMLPQRQQRGNVAVRGPAPNDINGSPLFTSEQNKMKNHI
jgi:hypothetical protein